MLDNVKEAPVKARESVGNWWSDFRGFLTDVRSEMKRVTWPSRREGHVTRFNSCRTSDRNVRSFVHQPTTPPGAFLTLSMMSTSRSIPQ